MQSNRTMNWTEHCAVVHRPQVPVMLVFQSVFFSSKRQTVLPPFEMVVHGLVVPGVFATRQPAGIGTWQLCEASPLAMPKLHACSVVAGNSDGIWAPGSVDGNPAAQNRNSAQPKKNTRCPPMFGWYHSLFPCGHTHDCVESPERQRSAG